MFIRDILKLNKLSLIHTKMFNSYIFCRPNIKIKLRFNVKYPNFADQQFIKTIKIYVRFCGPVLLLTIGLM